MANTKRVALYLDVDAIGLLGRLAPSENKRGKYVSSLIREAATREGLVEGGQDAEQPPSQVEAETYSEIGRQVVELFEDVIEAVEVKRREF